MEEEDNVEEEDEHVAEDEVDDHDVAEDEVEDDEVEDDDVKGQKDDDVDVEEEEDDDVEEEDRSQDREAHFVRACAVEMYTDISQEPFCVEIYRKKCRMHQIPPRLKTSP